MADSLPPYEAFFRKQAQTLGYRHLDGTDTHNHRSKGNPTSRNFVLIDIWLCHFTRWLHQMTNANPSSILDKCEERTSKGTETKHGQSSVPFLILNFSHQTAEEALNHFKQRIGSFFRLVSYRRRRPRYKRLTRKTRNQDDYGCLTKST